jgi:hypothetical protein
MRYQVDADEMEMEMEITWHVLKQPCATVEQAGVAPHLSGGLHFERSHTGLHWTASTPASECICMQVE